MTESFLSVVLAGPANGVDVIMFTCSGVHPFSGAYISAFSLKSIIVALLVPVYSGISFVFIVITVFASFGASTGVYFVDLYQQLMPLTGAFVHQLVRPLSFYPYSIPLYPCLNPIV